MPRGKRFQPVTFSLFFALLTMPSGLLGRPVIVFHHIVCYFTIQNPVFQQLFCTRIPEFHSRAGLFCDVKELVICDNRRNDCQHNKHDSKYNSDCHLINSFYSFWECYISDSTLRLGLCLYARLPFHHLSLRLSVERIDIRAGGLVFPASIYQGILHSSVVYSSPFATDSSASKPIIPSPQNSAFRFSV